MDPLFAIQIKFYLERRGTFRSLYDQWRAAYLEAHSANCGIYNVRFVHDPEWRNNLLSCQAVGDTWRRIARDAVAPERCLIGDIERRTLQWAFDVAAWRAGLVWVDDDW
jgi:hypothetical protein